MREQIEAFLRLSKVFSDNAFHLYLVGGYVRDFLMGKDSTDIDLTTDATPDEMSSFLPNVDMTFSKYGSIRVIFDETKFEITTLRIERGYHDFRHPSKIIFTRDLKKDSKRRDFTMNGMYMDDRFKVHDFVGGEKDISKKVIKTIGIPYIRFREDPLRIVRAIRFSLMFGFDIDKQTHYAMMFCSKYLQKLNIDKIKEEINKIHDVDETKKKNMLLQYHVPTAVDM